MLRRHIVGGQYFVPWGKAGQKPLEGIWLVDYYKPSCPPCRTLKRDIGHLSSTLKGIVEFVLIDCSTPGVCNVPFYPFLRLMIKRRGQTQPEAVDIDYDSDSHPGSIAINAIGIVLQHVIGFSWARTDPSPTPTPTPGSSCMSASCSNSNSSSGYDSRGNNSSTTNVYDNEEEYGSVDDISRWEEDDSGQHMSEDDDEAEEQGMCGRVSTSDNAENEDGYEGEEGGGWDGRLGGGEG
eukprot:GHVQ01006242.1.p1 GENE.GHVQ01006242.1~~GHVQ01006242.1.p1  ORF type:complete len:237 (+),score=53.81 GHVQ01006242.1:3-713(+)